MFDGYEVLDNIRFKRITTQAGETLGLYRIPSASGCAELVNLDSDTLYKPHVHDGVDAKFHMLRGNGSIILDKDEYTYDVGDVFYVPKGTPHGFRTKERTIFLSLQSKPIRDEKTGKIDIRYVE
jgi:quercetin dioxygenase-like cupin family protein